MRMYKLPESLTIHNVKEVQESLLLYLEEKALEDDQIIIDANELNDVDASGLQLLVSACKTLKGQEKEYIVENIKDDLENVLRTSGALDIIVS